MKQWPKNNAYPWETAPFLRILLPFAGGVLCYYNNWFYPVSLFAYLVLAFLLSALYILLVFANKSGRQLANAVLVFTALWAFGLSVAGYSDVQNSKNWFGNDAHFSQGYLANIIATPAEKEKSWRLEVNVVAALDDESLRPVEGKAYVYMQKDDIPYFLQRGDTILLPGNWERMRDAGNPYEFAYATYCARNNVLYRQWCKSSEVRLYAAQNAAAASVTQRIHGFTLSQLDKYLGIHKARGLLQAMLMGDEVNLDPDLRNAYSRTGIVHIIAISGGNVAMFFIVVSFLLGWIKNRKYLWVKYIVALPIVWVYVLAAGAQPSAVRAAVMFSLLSVGLVMQKKNDSVNQLLATAFVLLLAAPEWLFSVGFQLSFIAVLSISIFYKYIYNWVPHVELPRKGGNLKTRLKRWLWSLPNKLWSAVAMSIAAEILVAPLVIYYFHNFPVMFIVANVAALLFMGVVLVAGMILIVVSSVPLLATSVAAAIVWLVDVFGAMITSMQIAEPESFRFLSVSGWELFVAYVAVACLVYYFLHRHKRALLYGVSVLCVLFLFLCVDEWKLTHQHRIVVYNVPNACHIELVKGNTFSVVHTDSAYSKSINYATLPSHTAWHARRELSNAHQQLYRLAGKTFLVLGDALTNLDSFSVDCLVISNMTGRDMSRLITRYRPSLVVVSNNLTQGQMSAVKEACKVLGVAVHNVKDEGAYIAEL